MKTINLRRRLAALEQDLSSEGVHRRLCSDVFLGFSGGFMSVFGFAALRPRIVVVSCRPHG
jgi:hypothetical protein